MESFKLSTWAEVVGIAAVVVSLVFVGIEIRHNTAATSAQALLELNNAFNEISLLQAEEAGLADIMLRGDSDLDSLGPIEHRRYVAFTGTLMNTFENAYMFHKSGILDSDTYRGYAEALCIEMALPGTRRLWMTGEFVLHKVFNDFIEKTCGISR